MVGVLYVIYIKVTLIRSAKLNHEISEKYVLS